MSYRWIAKSREDHVLHMLSELVSEGLLNYFGHQTQIKYWTKVRILLVVCICFLKCHCLRKCSRGQNLWSTDLAETWHRSRLP